MAPGILLLKQSIFHHVNHITTDPLLRTRSFTVSVCPRRRTAEHVLGEPGLGQYLVVAQISRTVQTRGAPGNEAMLTCAPHWLFPRPYQICEFIELLPMSLTSKADGILPIY